MAKKDRVILGTKGPKIGAHVSAAVSLELSFEKAQSIGAEVTQIFISPPQQWFQTKHGEEETKRFRDKETEVGIGPNFIHGTYLINLGTQNPEHLEKSIDWLIYAMNFASQIKSSGLIFHLGSHKGVGFEKVLPQIVASLSRVLKKTNKPENEPTTLILETSAGAGGGLGGTFTELGQILKGVLSDKLKICIDTQHIFAAGYDIRTPLGLNNVLAEFDKEIGLKNLAVIHANDSKTELKSGRDRHENIGEGFIGQEGFAGLLNHPQLANIPFILEVPGFSGTGPDAENVKLLKSLIK